MSQTLLIAGANRGIGLAMAAHAAARGDTVIATARFPNKAEALAALAQSSSNVEIKALDVLNDASLAALAGRLAGRRIDVLVANAGVLNSYGGLDDPAHDKAAWADVLMTNVYGPFALIRALRPSLVGPPAGKLAIISSGMGSTTRARTRGAAYPYCASKAAATNLAANLSAELQSDGIAVGAYHPGWVRTDMGGPSADISVEESAAGLLERFDALSLATTGLVEDYRGEPIAL